VAYEQYGLSSSEKMGVTEICLLRVNIESLVKGKGYALTWDLSARMTCIHARFLDADFEGVRWWEGDFQQLM
jgi:hypothetical protein